VGAVARLSRPFRILRLTHVNLPFSTNNHTSKPGVSNDPSIWHGLLSGSGID
jgi:hypothetical protein